MTSGRGLWRLAVFAAAALRHPGRPAVAAANGGDAGRPSSSRTASRSRCSATPTRSASASGWTRRSTPTATASGTGSRWTSSGRRRPTRASRCPSSWTRARTTHARPRERVRAQADVDGDGLLDKWPLFYDNYFVPRGYAVVLLDMVGTGNSTGCPTTGGTPSNLSAEVGIDWLNGRGPGYDKDGNLVSASWHNGKTGMIGKSYDGTLANGAAATGVEGPLDDRADLGDLELVRLRPLERASGSWAQLPGVASRTRSPTRPTAPAAPPSGRRSTRPTATRRATTRRSGRSATTTRTSRR